MVLLAINQLNTLNKSLQYLDIVMVIASFGVGIFAIVNPKRAWLVFQSKKSKAENQVPTEKMFKTTRIFGVVITILAIVFVWIAYL